MNITNENCKSKKLVGETVLPTMPELTLQRNKTNFRSCLRSFLLGVVDTISRYNDFEYGDIDEEKETPWMDKRP
jgi:hypothetical protein